MSWHDDHEPDRWPDRDVAAAIAGLVVLALGVLALLGAAVIGARMIQWLT